MWQKTFGIKKWTEKKDKGIQWAENKFSEKGIVVGKGKWQPKEIVVKKQEKDIIAPQDFPKLWKNLIIKNSEASIDKGNSMRPERLKTRKDFIGNSKIKHFT